MRALVLLVVLGHSASADPSPPAFRGGLEGALRAGAGSWGYYEDGSGNTYAASGWLVDGELGARLRPYLSVVGFASFASGRDTGMGEDACTWSYREHVTDVGVRARVHAYGAFAGLGVGLTSVAQNGPWSCPGPIGGPSGGVLDATRREMFVELHAGYTLPRIESCHCALEVFGAIAPGDVNTTRVAVGVAF